MKTKLLLFFATIIMSFGMNAQINSVAIVGTAVGGWPGSPGNPGPADLHQLTQIDANNWKIENLVVAAGPCKLRANNTWGGAGFEWAGAFPTDTGTSSGDIIVPTGGNYTVTLDTSTGIYNFAPGAALPVVKLVGSGVSTSGGILMNLSGPDTYSISNTTLLSGTVQFDVDGQVSGGTTFPTGTAINSTDFIPVPAAFFSSITINIATGAYTFVLIPPVSIIGDGVGGWPGSAGNPGPLDINQLTSTDGVNYKIDKLACTVGPAKFRQDNDWAVNWGNAAFPSGTGTQGGDNIAITTAGTYDVTFNRVTGAYNFSFPTIALVGGATGGWPGSPSNPGPIDTNQMTTTDGVTYTLANVALTADVCKFRANNSWDVNWGNAAFPSGTATQGGDNIAVATAGNYDVTLNRVTGAYNFTTTMSVNQFGETSFSLVPNPTKGMFAINADVAKAEIFNITGQLVKSFNNAAANESLSISELNQGIYFVKVTDLNLNEKTIKLIKE